MSLPGADGSHAPRATAQRPSPAKQLGLFPFCVCADTLCVLIVGGGKPQARLSVAPSSFSQCPCPRRSCPLCTASQQLGLHPSPGTGGSCLQSLFSSLLARQLPSISLRSHGAPRGMSGLCTNPSSSPGLGFLISDIRKLDRLTLRFKKWLDSSSNGP